MAGSDRRAAAPTTNDRKRTRLQTRAPRRRGLLALERRVAATQERFWQGTLLRLRPNFTCPRARRDGVGSTPPDGDTKAARHLPIGAPALVVAEG